MNDPIIRTLCRVTLGIVGVWMLATAPAVADLLTPPVPHLASGPLPPDRRDPVTRPHAPAQSPAQLPSGTWQALGPAPIGPAKLAGGGIYGSTNSGRITALSVIPSGTHQGRVVAGSAGGGIWTSDDSGSTWTPRTDSSPDLAVGALTIDPNNPNHLVAGTGEANQCQDCFAGMGLLVSTDGGTTWTTQNPSGVFTGLHIAQLAIDPSNSQHQFAATDGGLYVTTNGGTSWAKPTDPSYAPVNGGSTNITAVVIDPSNHNNVYIGGGNATVAKSTDSGGTWAAAATGIAAPGSFPFIALAIAPSAPATLYVSVGSTNNAVAVYKTTTSAGSWSQLGSAPAFTGQTYSYGSGSGEQGWYDNVLAVDPSNANHLLAGGITLVETTDGGTTWTNANGQTFFGGGTNKLHPDHHALVFAGDGSGTVWIADDGGVFHATPSSGSVTNGTIAAANGNLNITQFYYGFNVVGGSLLAGAQDNASARTGTLGSSTAWTSINSGDGGPSAITPNNTSLQFIEANQYPYVTTDAFNTTLTKLIPPALGLFTPPMLVVPNTATPGQPTVFYGGPQLYRSAGTTLPATNWQAVTTYGTGCSGGICVSAIAASADGQTVYVGFTDGTIQVSTAGGAPGTFTSAAAATLTTDTFVTGISVDPTNAKAITVSFSSSDVRSSPGLPHVQQFAWTTAPASGTWTTITGSGLPAAVSRVVYDNGALVAATDSGVYATGNVSGSSTSWSAVGSGLPNVQIQDLYLSGANVYVVTHGRGAWVLPSVPQNTGASTISGTARQGQALTVTQGTWANAGSIADQWQDCDSAGNNCTSIAGATGSTYVLTNNDAGHTIRVAETAGNANGSATASSAATAVVIPLPPSNTQAPAIAGAVQQGQMLTLSQGSWSNSPTSVSDQWQDCDSGGSNCSNISGATGSAYTLGASDVGHTLRVAETATNAGGTGGPASSTATAVVVPPQPGNAAAPVIAGSAQQGKTLTLTQGSWSNGPTSVSDQWQDCDSGGNNCSDISGATASTYRLTAADVGHRVRVAETASNAGGTGRPAGSATATVVPPLAAVQKITVSGTRVVAKVSCSGGPCQLKLTLSAIAHRRRGKLRTVTVGTASATILADQAATVRVPLNGTGNGLLRKAHRLVAQLKVVQDGRLISNRTVIFKKPGRLSARGHSAGGPAQDILHF